MDLVKDITLIAKKLIKKGDTASISKAISTLKTSYSLPLKSELNDSIDIILIPEITVEDEKTSKFENIKSKQIKDAAEKFLNKNAIKFAEEIFLAKKTHNGYLLNDIFINDLGENKNFISVDMSAKFVKLKNIGYSIVISMKKTYGNDEDSTITQNKKKRADELISAFKKKKKFEDKEVLLLTLRSNIEFRLRKLNMDKDSIKFNYDDLKDKQKFAEVYKMLVEKHNEIKEMKLPYKFRIFELYDMIDAVNIGADTWGEGDLVKLKVGKKNIDVFPIYHSIVSL